MIKTTLSNRQLLSVLKVLQYDKESVLDQRDVDIDIIAAIDNMIYELLTRISINDNDCIVELSKEDTLKLEELLQSV